jgi:hypothetical protein
MAYSKVLARRAGRPRSTSARDRRLGTVGWSTSETSLTDQVRGDVFVLRGQRMIGVTKHEQPFAGEIHHLVAVG